MSTQILRLKDVMSKTGLARSTIYARMADGSFPKSVALGGRVAGWLDHEIDDWIERCVLDSRQRSSEAQI